MKRNLYPQCLPLLHKTWALLLLAVLLSVQASAQLSGSYTINPSGSGSTNFKTFSSAVDTLKKYGVSGPVSFSVSNGTYTEQVSIPAITGASSTNRITFKSASGDSTKVILTYASSSSSTSNYTLQLNGADYFTFKQLTIQRTGSSTYGVVIDINNAATYNTFQNNRILGVFGSTPDYYKSLVYSSGSNDNYNTFSRNAIRRGDYGFYYYGVSSSSLETGTVIEYNQMDSINGYGAYMYYQSGLTLNNNRIEPLYSSAYGLYLSYCNDASSIYNNSINISNGGYGIYMYYCSGSSSAPARYYNNMVSMTSIGTVYGLYINYCTYQDFVYNSISLPYAAVVSYAVYITGSSSYPGINFYNNIIHNNSGYAIYAGTSGSISASNYNDIYAPGIYYIVSGATYASLSAWQATGMDLKSIAEDPMFYSFSNLHVKAVPLDGAAKPYSGITTDFDGQTRNSSTPDIGADEFTPPAKDLGIIAIVNPLNNSCGDSNTVVGVVVRNLGSAGQSSFTVNAKVTGSATATMTKSYTSTLASLKNDTIYFSTKLNTYAGGTYNISAYTSLSGDQDLTNDTLKSTVKINAIPAAIKVKNDTVCSGTQSMIIPKKNVGGYINWYSTASGGTPFFTGDTLKKTLTSTKTYYAEEGPVSKSITTTYAGGVSTFTGNMFDIKPNKDISITSFDINTSATGAITVDLYYKTGTYVGYESTPSAWTKLGTTTAIGKGAGTGTNVKFSPLALKSRQRYGLFILITKGGNIVYTSASSNYSNADIDSLTLGAGFNGPFTNLVSPRTWNGTIYYNLGGSCASPRSPVTIVVKPRPTGATIIKGGIFNGSFSSNNPISPDVVCTGNTISYELTPPAGYTNAQFGTKWYFTKFSFATAKGTAAKDTSLSLPGLTSNAKLSFKPTRAFGDSTVYLSVTIALPNGCDSTLVRSISVSAVPVARFGVKNTCLGNSVSFTDSATTGAQPIIVMSYNYGDGITETFTSRTSPAHTYSKPGTYSVVQKVFNSAGCFDSTTRKVSVYPVPVPGFTIPSACAGTSLAFSDSSYIASGSVTYYFWRFGDAANTTSTNKNPSFTYSKSGKYRVTHIVWSDKGCIDSITKTITVNAKPVVSFTASSGCEGSVTQFSSTGSSSYAYAWQFGDGNTSTQVSPAHLYTRSGKYTVTLTMTNTTTGCTETGTRIVAVYAKPVPAFYTSDVCLGTANSFTNTSTSADTIRGYFWDFGDGNTATTQNAVHKYSASGSYHVKFAVSTIKGCSDTFTQDVTVFPRSKAWFGATTVCAGKPTQFTDSSTISTGTIQSRLWVFGGGKTSTATNPSFLFSAGGQYKVKLYVQSSSGCTDSVERVVTVLALPKIGFTAWVSGRKVTFTPTDSTFSSYAWDFGDGGTGSQANTSHTYSKDGKFRVSLNIVNKQGCSGNFADSVTIKTTGIQPTALPLSSFKLYPNPFSESFSMQYTLDHPAHVQAVLYDISGRALRELFDTRQESGDHSYQSGDISSLAAGMYLLRLSVDGAAEARWLVKLR